VKYQNIEIRIVLEGLAGDLAAKNISALQLKLLEQILEQVGALEKMESGNIKELMQCEFDFRNLVYETTHNPKLSSILKKLHGVSAHFWHYQIFSKQELLDQYIDHREVLDALKKGGGRRSGDTLKNHIQKVLKKLGDKVVQ